MSLHEPSIERIETLSNDANLHIFQALVSEAEEEERDIGQVCMPLIEDGDEFAEGTWVPELWYVVRKVLPNEVS